MATDATLDRLASTLENVNASMIEHMMHVANPASADELENTRSQLLEQIGRKLDTSALPEELSAYNYIDETELQVALSAKANVDSLQVRLAARHLCAPGGPSKNVTALACGFSRGWLVRASSAASFAFKEGDTAAL
jgi:hypothetical protein